MGQAAGTGPAIAGRKFFLVLHVTGVALIILLSLMPEAMLPIDGGSDKVKHLAAYGAVMLAGCGAYDRKRLWGVTALGLLLLGAVLEGLQGGFFGREASLGDMVANAAGILLALTVGKFLERRWPWRERGLSG